MHFELAFAKENDLHWAHRNLLLFFVVFLVVMEESAEASGL